MAELALYRKWRSKTFEELVGQPHLTQTLKNAIASGKTAHAYLFCGPRGTGKTSAAKILAKALNCEKGPTPVPCNACATCQGITDGSILDCIEIDAASNRGIDEIRDLREKVKFSPTRCRYKVYIVDEVHMLTPEAFNALLKTLEEPPPHAVFVLCTTEPHKLLPTVISRCQRFDFNRIPSPVMEARLEEICKAESLAVEPGVLSLVALAAEGSLRDALSLLDQLRTFCQGEIKKEDALFFLGQTPRAVLEGLVLRIQKRDLKDLLAFLHESLARGLEFSQLIRDLLLEFRKILLFKIAPETLDISNEEKRYLTQSSPLFQGEELYRILRVLSDLRQGLRYSPHPRLLVEMALMRILKAEWEPSLEGLKRRIDLLESSKFQAPPEKLIPEKKEAPPKLSPLSLEAFQKGWPDLIEKLRTSRSPLFAILQETKPVQLSGNLLTLALPYAFHKNKLEQKKEEVRALLKDIFNFEVILEAKVQTPDHKAFIEEAAQIFPGTVVVGESS